MRVLYFRDHAHTEYQGGERPTIRASLQDRRASLEIGTALITRVTEDNADDQSEEARSCSQILASYINSFCIFVVLLAFPNAFAPMLRDDNVPDSLKVFCILFFIPAAHDFALLFERGLRLDSLTEEDAPEHISLPLANLHLHFLLDLSFCCMKSVFDLLIAICPICPSTDLSF